MMCSIFSGVTVDIIHMDTGAVGCSFLDSLQVEVTLMGMVLVFISASVPRTWDRKR